MSDLLVGMRFRAGRIDDEHLRNVPLRPGSGPGMTVVAEANDFWSLVSGAIYWRTSEIDGWAECSHCNATSKLYSTKSRRWGKSWAHHHRCGVPGRRDGQW